MSARQKTKKQYLALLDPNSNQFYVYDEKNDFYIDPPKDLLKEMDYISRVLSVSEAIEILELLVNGATPSWVYDEEAIFAELL